MEQLILSLGDSPVRTCPAQVQVEALSKALDRAFSEKCSDWLKKPDAHISSLKMSRGFSLDQRKIQVNGSVNFSTRWPASGMMLNGSVLPLPALVDHMKESASVWLPTPTKHLSKEGGYPSEYTRNTPSLTAQLAGGLNGVAPNAEYIEWMMGFPLGHTDVDRE